MEPSKRALDAIKAFKKEVPEMFHRYPNLYNKLIFFFIDTFKVDIDRDALPQHHLLETAKEQELRRSVTSRLMKEFAEIWGDYQDKEEDISATLLYWWLGQHHRTPSNLGRSQLSSQEPIVGCQTQRVSIRRAFAAAHLSHSLPQIIGHDYPHNHVIDDASDSSEEELDQNSCLESEHQEIASNQSESNWNIGSEYDDVGTDGESTREPLERSFDNKAKEISASDRPRGSKIQLNSIGLVDRRLVLDHLLLKTKESYATRYGEFLASDIGRTVVDTLEGFLNPTVRDVCEQGVFELSR
jgi:hypothetical protein